MLTLSVGTSWVIAEVDVIRTDFMYLRGNTFD